MRIAQSRPSSDQLRWFIAKRSRIAEDALAAAVAAQGTRQLVVLGAGLDTYAYRGALAKNLRVLEVDHPATQRWKRELLADAAIPLPESLTFVPIEFEDATPGRAILGDASAAGGFDSNQRTFFGWLGVVVYLSEDTIFSTLRFIASLVGGADVVFDYGNPIPSLPERQDRTLDKIASPANEVGETFLTFFHTDEIYEKVTSLGFSSVVDFGPKQLAAQFLANSESSLSGCHVIQASI
jgi:methyltransferase (TIGR00027 family)